MGGSCIIDAKSNVIYADNLFASRLMDLKNRLILARHSKLNGLSVMRRAGQLLKPECFHELHVLGEVTVDQFDVINTSYHC